MLTYIIRHGGPDYRAANMDRMVRELKQRPALRGLVSVELRGADSVAVLVCAATPVGELREYCRAVSLDLRLVLA